MPETVELYVASETADVAPIPIHALERPVATEAALDRAAGMILAAQQLHPQGSDVEPQGFLQIADPQDDVENAQGPRSQPVRKRVPRARPAAAKPRAARSRKAS